MRRAASLLVSICTRTAYYDAADTFTCATRWIIEMREAIIISAYSSKSESGMESDVAAMKMMCGSPGLDLRNEGGVGMPGGSKGIAAAIAVCTSTAAPSMSRFKSNVSVILLDPWLLFDIIESMPAMVVNCRSSTVATDDAMVSALAPGRPANTDMVGKSTSGKSLTGSTRTA